MSSLILDLVDIYLEKIWIFNLRTILKMITKWTIIYKQLYYIFRIINYFFQIFVLYTHESLCYDIIYTKCCNKSKNKRIKTVMDGS